MEGAARRDDTLALVLRRTPVDAEQQERRWTLDPVPQQAGATRRAATSWLADRGQPTDDVALVLGELLANAVTHACRAVQLRLVLTEHRLLVEVRDDGPGFAVDAPVDAPTETPYGVVTVSHVCLNDDVVEGLELRDAEGRLKSFSVQYHPEAAAGPHDAAYLFDRFWRGRAATGTPGSGVGLTVVAELVRAHGGRIEVTSTPGTGTTFTVCLPKAA